MNTKRQAKIASSPRFTLVGHADNISTIATYGSQYIVSGSWDATVKVWKNWQCVQTFTKHTLAVWSVLPIDAERFLSASADKSVYLWAIDQADHPINSYKGATQPVRGLALLSPAQFASAGNDTEIRTYALDNSNTEPSQILSGHTSFVYSLATRSSDTLISSGEDHTLRVWHNATLAQVITLPAISVWCTCVMPNGDVACGSSDGQVRVFTTDLQRTDAERIAAFESQVQSQVLADSEFDANTPRGEHSLLKQSGSQEGATCVVQDGSRNEVYRWASHKKQWKPIGIITESAGSTQKKIHDGKAYDYVFDVDVEDGAPPLKLPYNANENPYEAAQRFLQAYELPSSYLDQVVQFLQKNTQSLNLAAPTASDPYTGSSGYHVGSAQGTTASNTADQQRNIAMDPFTGSGGITSAAQSHLQVIPYAEYLAFPQANLQAAREKIQQLAGDDAPLSETDAGQLDSLVNALQNNTQANVDVVSRLLSDWPIAKRFPLLDLLRIAACKPSSAPFSTFATSALIGADWDALESQSDRKVAQTNAMLALRTLSNGFQAPNGTNSMNEMALEVRMDL
ncbi:hypothetical protein MYAM1_003319 [Malassezia yamatoensis]|uniref:PFU-domain-containing protein n=1 Tax=Malassezia yamatoensis TaxID=253288 RepID=A0AAJ5YZT9_9BASI|nr:hypothetical protein MYAM1_003319 [Malassezia yamatoensis]